MRCKPGVAGLWAAAADPHPDHCGRSDEKPGDDSTVTVLHVFAAVALLVKLKRRVVTQGLLTGQGRVAASESFLSNK